jgi:hypothetical protein
MPDQSVSDQLGLLVYIGPASLVALVGLILYLLRRRNQGRKD